MPARQRQRLIMGGSLLVALTLGAWVVLQRQPAKAVAAQPIPVTAARAVSEDVPLTVSAIGNAQAWTSDAIFAQVSGKLTRVDFAEGADVKAGQLLAQVDPGPYQAALLQAEGSLAKDRAMLAGAERDLERYQRLLAENAIAAKLVDDQAATVAQDKGAVLLDQGQVAAARINLAYCNITSPISGRAGVRLVDPGNLVTAGGSMASAPSTAAATNNAAAAGSSSGGAGGSSIVVINQIQPIAVTFTVPEGQFQRLLVASNGFTRPLAVQAYSQETGALLDGGQLAVADNRVDAATGTVQLKARFPNAARQLWPGQFVNVKLVLQTLRNATVIPAAAVNRGPQGQFAFVVSANHTAVARPVAIEGTEGASVVVKSGVTAGDLIVTDGQMVLKNGSLVRVAQAASSPRPAS